ncbi:gfo/Idh/MocA family oxidoreductase [bacterium]|nr:gfo/Idh/MocA family oxidoreductase [bacterium]
MNNTVSAHSPARQSRRAFMKSSATIATATALTRLPEALAAGQAPSASVVGANDRIVVGHIGTGAQGMAHVRSQQAHATENNIVQAAVCDLYERRLKEAQSKVGLADKDAYDDYRRLLERKDIDAVTVATVDNWHAQVAIDAMESGKHVYGEKPMTRYLPEAFDVYDMCKRTGKVFQLGSQGCADSKYRAARKWIKEGRLGPLVWGQASYCRNSFPKSEWTYPIDPDVSEANLNWKMWLGKAKQIPFNPEHYFSWHKFYAYNSGILGNLLPHRVTPLMLAMPEWEFPRRVTCTGTRAISTDRETTDTTHLLAEFPSGFTLLVAGTIVNEQGLPDTIRGQKGTLHFASSQNKVELKPERPFVDEMDSAEFSTGDPTEDLARHEKNWFDCIRSGELPFANIELGIRSHTVICLAEMSERLQRTMLFDEKTRKIHDGTGREIEPISYDSDAPVRQMS